jgi:hypothetical protein
MRDVAENWHTFMIRKTLLTHWSAFDFGAHVGTVRTPLIRDTAASLLFIDLMSILDGALETVMTPAAFARGRKLGNRLEMLRSEGRLLDPDALVSANRRRNEIGHELEKGATVAELDVAIYQPRRVRRRGSSVAAVASARRRAAAVTRCRRSTIWEWLPSRCVRLSALSPESASPGSLSGWKPFQAHGLRL